MPYIGSAPTKVVSRQSATVYRYTATAGQTVFSGADLDNAVLACNPADMIVHMNGIRLESTDYTATSTSVTLVVAAAAGDEVTVTSFQTFEVADTYDKATADTRYVNASGDTMTGGLNVTGGNVGIGTSSPTKHLTVESDAGPTIRVSDTTGNDEATLNVASGSNYNIVAMPTSGSNAYGLEFRQGSSTRLSILNGGGITFNGDTAAANALDDYEEGTWTPSVFNSASSGGYYIKIGRQVTLHFYVASTNSTSTNAVEITNLPFAVADVVPSTSHEAQGVVSYHTGIATSDRATACVVRDGSYIDLRSGGTNNFDVIYYNNHTGNWNIRGTVTYTST